jgi:hypothetical protein
VVSVLLEPAAGVSRLTAGAAVSRVNVRGAVSIELPASSAWVAVTV